jgi:hypothetical protein
MTHEDLAHEAEMDRAAMPAVIVVGDEFATPFERGCLALTDPDERGEFVGTDSDGVEVSFHVDMIAEVTREAVPPVACPGCGESTRPCACDSYEAALEMRGYRW